MRAGRQLALLACRRTTRADAAGDRQQRIGRDDRLADADFEFGVCERGECANGDEQRERGGAKHGKRSRALDSERTDEVPNSLQRRRLASTGAKGLERRIDRSGRKGNQRRGESRKSPGKLVSRSKLAWYLEGAIAAA